MTTSIESRAYSQKNLGHDMNTQEDDGTLHVLLVEDSLGDELMAIRALDATNIKHKLDTLRTGHQVLPYLEACLKDKEKLPDVIMLDLGMPGVDGFSVLEYLGSSAEAFRHIPIILTTGYEHVDYLSRMMGHLPILACIEKPCNKDKLIQALSGIGGKFMKAE